MNTFSKVPGGLGMGGNPAFSLPASFEVHCFWGWWRLLIQDSSVTLHFSMIEEGKRQRKFMPQIMGSNSCNFDFAWSLITAFTSGIMHRIFLLLFFKILSRLYISIIPLLFNPGLQFGIVVPRNMTQHWKLRADPKQPLDHVKTCWSWRTPNAFLIRKVVATGHFHSRGHGGSPPWSVSQNNF